MSAPSAPRQRRCPACGSTYGEVGVRCYPGAARVVTTNGAGIPAHCGVRGRLEVPPAMPDDIRRTVRELRSAGAAWEVVDAWLRRFGLRRPEEPTPMRPTTRGTWPPAPPTPSPDGPRPPRPARQPGARRPYVESGQESSVSYGCPNSVTGHGSADKDGKCPWCGKQLRGPQPAPRRYPDQTEQGGEWRRHYDPDHGSDQRDT